MLNTTQQATLKAWLERYKARQRLDHGPGHLTAMAHLEDLAGDIAFIIEQWLAHSTSSGDPDEGI